MEENLKGLLRVLTSLWRLVMERDTVHFGTNISEELLTFYILFPSFRSCSFNILSLQLFSLVSLSRSTTRC